MNPKHWLGSKTLWVNILGGIGTTAGLVTGVIPGKYAPVITAVGGIANILLRLVTKQPLTTGDPDQHVDVSGRGATIGLVLLVLGLSLPIVSCTRPDLPTLLTWAQYGIDADCHFGAGALAADVCTFGTDTISAAKAAVARDPQQGLVAAKQILRDAETRQPAIAPYTHWLTARL